MRGIVFIPDNVKPDIDKVTPRPTHMVTLSRRNF
jgi:hypothetical protein